MEFSKNRIFDWLALFWGAWTATSAIWTTHAGNSLMLNVALGSIIVVIALGTLALPGSVLLQVFQIFAASALFFAPLIGDYMHSIGAAWSAFIPAFFVAFCAIFSAIDAAQRTASQRYKLAQIAA